MELTKKERELIDKVTLLVVANGNTVNPKPYIPSPEEYKLMHQIRIKMGFNKA